MPSDAVPRSTIPELVWPALPAAVCAQLLALQQQLGQTQWWSPDRLAHHQFRQLAPLLTHAYDCIPFYRARLSAAGYRRGQEITREFWTRLPVLPRREVQEQGAAITCREPLPEHGRVVADATSGSTGTPLTIAKTELALAVWSAIALRRDDWHPRDLRLKFAAIRRVPDDLALPPAGRSLPDWSPPISAVYPTGPCVLLDNRSTPQEQAEWLLREEPDYLLAYPSAVQELARYFGDHGLRLKRLKSISTMGEVVTARLRAACREALGVGIVDVYSATEVGNLALQCPLHEHYHIQSEVVLLEVLDEAGNPCRPGEVGTVVATPLHNFAMPLLRYAPGDLAEVGGPCSCGRSLPVLKEILGRARDTVMLPSGTRRYAWMGMKRMGEMREVVQFQVVQRTLYDLEIKLVTRAPLAPAQEEQIRQTLKKSLGEHFSVVITYHDAIARTASGKYVDFVSEVPG